MANHDHDTVYTNDGVNRSIYTRESSSTGWFVGIIVALALLAIGYLVFTANSGPSTATVNTPPAVETPMTDPAITTTPMTEAPPVDTTTAPAVEAPAPVTEAPAPAAEPAPMAPAAGG